MGGEVERGEASGERREERGERMRQQCESSYFTKDQNRVANQTRVKTRNATT